MAELNEKYAKKIARDIERDGFGGWTRAAFDPTIENFAIHSGDYPDREYYRPNWPEETMTHYQMYETVSEGTPLSPVFPTKEALGEWLRIREGYSQEAVDAFLEYESAPSFVMDSKGLHANLDGLVALKED